MKKFINLFTLFLFIGLMMQSCKEERNTPTVDDSTKITKKALRMNQDAYDQILMDLDNLDLSYGFSSVSEISTYEDWDFTEVGGCWGVFAADAEGACHGADIGERIGGKWGAVIGAVAVGASSSVAEYIKEKNDNDNDNDGMQVVFNPSNPFDYTRDGNRFNYGGWAPIGSEIGDLHNSMVNEILTDIGNSNQINTLSELYDYVCYADFNTLNTLFTPQQISDVQTYLSENQTDIITDLEDNGMTTLWLGHPDEMEIIKHYAFVMTRPMFFDRFQYTMDFMTIIDQAYQSQLLSEESAVIINGTISTFYCSKTAWNYIQPDPFFNTDFIIRTDNSWFLTNNQEHLQQLMISNGDINFVGYPYIENDTIKRIYVYANDPLNTEYGQSDLILSLGEIFTNNISSISILDNNRTCAPIAIGNYPIYPAAEYEDYIFIDLESHMDLNN